MILLANKTQNTTLGYCLIIMSVATKQSHFFLLFFRHDKMKSQSDNQSTKRSEDATNKTGQTKQITSLATRAYIRWPRLLDIIIESPSGTGTCHPAFSSKKENFMDEISTV